MCKLMTKISSFVAIAAIVFSLEVNASAAASSDITIIHNAESSTTIPAPTMESSSLSNSTDSILSEASTESSTTPEAITTAPQYNTDLTLTSDVPVQDSDISISSTTAPTTTTIERLDSPYTEGLLANEDLYNYVMDYLDEGVKLDTQGTGILIGEDIINKETNENAEETEAQKFTSGEKVMYSVATRDGSIFYIIIDKGANGENVYFLNSVDIVDLASLINTDEEKMSAQEKEIYANANTVTDATDGNEVPADNDGSGENRNNSASSSENNKTSSAKKDNTFFYIVIGIFAVVAIIIGWYLKVGPGKKKNVGFDDDENEEEEYYEEETDGNEVPAEEAYDEDDNM